MVNMYRHFPSHLAYGVRSQSPGRPVYNSNIVEQRTCSIGNSSVSFIAHTNPNSVLGSLGAYTLSGTENSQEKLKTVAPIAVVSSNSILCAANSQCANNSLKSLEENSFSHSSCLGNYSTDLYKTREYWQSSLKTPGCDSLYNSPLISDEIHNTYFQTLPKRSSSGVTKLSICSPVNSASKSVFENDGAELNKNTEDSYSVSFIKKHCEPKEASKLNFNYNDEATFQNILSKSASRFSKSNSKIDYSNKQNTLSVHTTESDPENLSTPKHLNLSLSVLPVDTMLFKEIAASKNNHKNVVQSNSTLQHLKANSTKKEDKATLSFSLTGVSSNEENKFNEFSNRCKKNLIKVSPSQKESNRKNKKLCLSSKFLSRVDKSTHLNNNGLSISSSNYIESTSPIMSLSSCRTYPKVINKPVSNINNTKLLSTTACISPALNDPLVSEPAVADKILCSALRQETKTMFNKHRTPPPLSFKSSSYKNKLLNISTVTEKKKSLQGRSEKSKVEIEQCTSSYKRTQ